MELPSSYEQVSAWGALPYGLDLSAARRLAAHNPAWVDIPPAACLAAPANLGRIDLTRHETERFCGRARVTALRAGICHGLAGWFEAELTASERISNAPPLRFPSWRQGFLPLEHPLAIRAGEVLDLELRAEVNGSLWLWRIAPADEAGSGPSPAGLGSTVAGRLLSMQSLRAGAVHATPRLSAQGQAQAFVLGSMDGSRSVQEIAADAAERFPTLLRGPADALKLVRHLARRFGETDNADSSADSTKP